LKLEKPPEVTIKIFKEYQQFPDYEIPVYDTTTKEVHTVLLKALKEYCKKESATTNYTTFVMKKMAELSRKTGTVEKELLIEELKKSIDETLARKVLSKLIQSGLIFEPRPGYIKKV